MRLIPDSTSAPKVTSPEPRTGSPSGEGCPFLAREGEDPLTCAFTSRRPLLPWGRDQRVEEERILEAWGELMSGPRRGRTAVYLHVPFCSTRCLFCGFYRNATRKLGMRDYAEAVCEEIVRDSEHRWVASGPIQSVYLGGGTPTDLDPDSLSRILSTLKKRLPLSADCEITVEGRIWGFDEEKIAACLENGANRFSFGVQSFDTDLRRSMGRKVSGDEARAFLTALLESGNAVVVCDLIYGLPGQSRESWEQDVQTVCELELDGVDLYAYARIPQSPLVTALDKGRFPSPPAVDEQARMFASGHDVLRRHGWRQISSAHFSRETRERNLYNQMTKGGCHVIPFGSGAGGNVDAYACQLAPQLDRYNELCQAGYKPLTHLGKLPASHRPATRITEAIEAGRIDPRWIEASGCPGFAERADPLLTQWERAGLLTRHHELAELTLAGRFWHTNLTLGLQSVVRALLEPEKNRPEHPNPTPLN